MNGVRAKRVHHGGVRPLRDLGSMPPPPELRPATPREPREPLYIRVGDKVHDGFWFVVYAPLRFWKWLDVRHPEKGHVYQVLIQAIIWFTLVVLPTLIPHHYSW